MNTKQKAILASAALALGVTAGCANMSEGEKGAAVGAGLGGVAGHVISGGSTAGTVAGAVVGGVVGHEVRKDK